MFYAQLPVVRRVLGWAKKNRAALTGLAAAGTSLNAQAQFGLAKLETGMHKFNAVMGASPSAWLAGVVAMATGAGIVVHGVKSCFIAKTISSEASPPPNLLRSVSVCAAAVVVGYLALNGSGLTSSAAQAIVEARTPSIVSVPLALAPDTGGVSTTAEPTARDGLRSVLSGSDLIMPRHLQPVAQRLEEGRPVSPRQLVAFASELSSYVWQQGKNHPLHNQASHLAEAALAVAAENNVNSHAVAVAHANMAFYTAHGVGGAEQDHGEARAHAQSSRHAAGNYVGKLDQFYLRYRPVP